MVSVPQSNSGAARPRPPAVRAHSARCEAEAESLHLLMLGPSLSVRGGVSAVENTLLKTLPPEIHVTHIATMVEGSKWRKLLTFAHAAIREYRNLRRRPDIVHIHFSTGASSIRKVLLGRLAVACGAKVIMHAHGGRYPAYWSRSSAAARAAILKLLRRVHCVIVLGESWREFFERIGVPAGKIVVLPNPVALPEALPTRLARPHVHLVYLGLIARHKGPFDLVEAVARVSPETLLRLRVVIAGNGETARLREVVEQLGIERVVEVREWIAPAERDRLLASADVLALPSYGEGLPMAVLEAMAWGLPVICTPVGSVPEYVRDQESGLLVQPGDIAQLAGAIERIVSDDAERARMGKRARMAVEPLGVDRYAQRIVALYYSLAGIEAPHVPGKPRSDQKRC